MADSIFTLQFWTSDSEQVRNLIWTVATLIGLPVLLIRARANQVSARAAASQAKTGERGKLADRFAAAIADLSCESEVKKIGAVHALETLAYETEKDHWMIMELLAAHVRQSQAKGGTRPRAITVDVEQALKALGSRGVAYARQDAKRGWKMNLSDIDLTGASLAGCRFGGANFAGTSLSHSDLGDIDLSNADLSNVNLDGASMRNAKLARANLRRSSLRGCNLREACLTEANLWGADLTGSLLGDASMNHALMWSAVLSGASMVGSKIEGALLGEAKLENAILSKGTLENACLLGADDASS